MTYRKVLVFWLPLFFAWLLMTFEGAWIQGVISRKPDSETQLAAFGLLFSLSILIETPVIMLLATSSALSRDQQSSRSVAVHDGDRPYRHDRRRPDGIYAAARSLPGRPLDNPAAYHRSDPPRYANHAPLERLDRLPSLSSRIIIRFGKTRYVGYGTIVRVCFSCGVSLGLGVVTQLAGSVVAPAHW